MDYVSIRVSTLRGDQKIDFNAYVKINDKMILYLRRGDSFEGERLNRLKEKKLRKMYIVTDEENNYRNYLQKNIDIAYSNNSNKDIKTRSEIIHGSQQSYTEEIFDNPENAVIYNSAKDAASKYANFIETNDAAFASIMNIENTDKNVAHHGVTVATIAVALAKKLKIEDPKKIQLLTLGALLHDFGHQNSSLNVAQPLAQMDAADKMLWNHHSRDGSTRVQDKKHFDPLVISIIAQHEETLDGSGPLGLHERAQDPLSIIVSTANALDRLITFEGVSKKEAGKILMIDRVGKHPLEQIQFLNELTKHL